MRSGPGPGKSGQGEKQRYSERDHELEGQGWITPGLTGHRKALGFYSIHNEQPLGSFRGKTAMLRFIFLKARSGCSERSGMVVGTRKWDSSQSTTGMV